MATTSPERIASLDIVRGIAVMGILSVNIIVMALPSLAFEDPGLYGMQGTADRAVWLFNAVFVEDRFRSLFSILFGASATLVLDRARAAGRAEWAVHFPRMLVLLLFGALHFYLLWWGDILINYAVVGMALYFFWRLPLETLMAVALGVLAFHYYPNIVTGAAVLRTAEQAFEQGGAEGRRAAIQQMFPRNDAAERERDIAQDMRANSSVFEHVRAQTSGERLAMPLRALQTYGLETLGLMLLGMALFRSGFLAGVLRRRSYLLVALGCLSVDWAFHAVAAAQSLRADFSSDVHFAWQYAFPSPLHPVGAVGYAALVMALFHRPGALATRLAAVGRAAFTNYLGASIIGTLLFSGSFLGLYGQLGYAGAWLIALPVWAFMLAWSKWWLDRYRYGPFEWLWRSLARGKPQPMRR